MYQIKLVNAFDERKSVKQVTRFAFKIRFRTKKRKLRLDRKLSL